MVDLSFGNNAGRYWKAATKGHSFGLFLSYFRVVYPRCWIQAIRESSWCLKAGFLNGFVWSCEHVEFSEVALLDIGEFGIVRIM
jgi:hypothetical protein